MSSNYSQVLWVLQVEPFQTANPEAAAADRFSSPLGSHRCWLRARRLPAPSTPPIPPDQHPEADICWRTVTRGHLPGQASLLRTDSRTDPLLVSPPPTPHL
ncbi:unnamed protein product [Pleuronectes platessa]|uniref:Uncharacterized protein n=1 Tax=Pleuronectes platessa TaxID=8262 RepID=A0A9N7VD34_PLEPL|nr:unnamed protein product [Pleuronectes platessa]